MIENVSTQLTVFHCLCPLPASRKGLRLTLRSALLEKEAEIGGRVIQTTKFIQIMALGPKRPVLGITWFI